MTTSLPLSATRLGFRHAHLTRVPAGTTGVSPSAAERYLPAPPSLLHTSASDPDE